MNVITSVMVASRMLEFMQRKVDVIYPIRINGEECTPEECEKLMKEITKYDKAGEE